MYLSQKACSVTFRSKVMGVCPAIVDNESYRKMLEYLIFGAYFCKESGKLVISREIFAQVEKTAADTNYSAKEFIEAFNRDMFTLQLNAADHITGLARTVERYLPEPLFSFVMAEFNGHWKDDDKVYFFSGKSVNPKNIKIERDAIMEYAQTFSTDHPQQKALIDYLNKLPPNRFTRLMNNFGAAYIKVAELQSENTRNRQNAILRSIMYQLKPFYKPGDHSTRVFPLNESFLLLQRDVRAALCMGWYDFDLKYAQLATVATLWNIKYVQDVIEHTSGPWEYYRHILGPMDVEIYAEFKPIIKKLVYSTIYGMSVSNLRKQANIHFDALDAHGAGDIFMNADLTKELIRARNSMLRKATGSMYDAFGHEIVTHNPRSKLAQQVQSYELKLLMPVLDVAKTTQDFLLTAWIHDGFMLDITRRHDAWIKKVSDTVKETAHAEGINTGLEVVHL